MEEFTASFPIFDVSENENDRARPLELSNIRSIGVDLFQRESQMESTLSETSLERVEKTLFGYWILFCTEVSIFGIEDRYEYDRYML